MTSYDIGDRPKLICTIRDEDGTAADPDNLTFQIREPDGEVTTYVYGTDAELHRADTGIYHVYWDCSLPGEHRYRFHFTGSLAGAAESKFRVLHTVFTA